MQKSKAAAKRQTMLWIVLTIALIVLALAILGALLAIACSAKSKPNVLIASPANGSAFKEGQDVSVRSTSTDSKGIVRVDLFVDGAVVRSDTLSTPQASFTIVQIWKAQSGQHTLTVRAYNTDGINNDPTNIAVNVAASPTVTPGGTTPTPAPFATGTLQPITCVSNSAKFADKSIPDGSVLAPNAPFNKTWQVLNTGACDWNANYRFVWIGGEQMSVASITVVPFTPRGSIAELTIAMTAPATPGPHVSHWQLRDDNGNMFGATFDVIINVPNPQPTPTCNGTPQIPFFRASANTVAPHSPVTFEWGLVTNASSVKLDPGVGFVTTPGKITLVVDNPTTYVLTALCGNTPATAQVTVNVAAPTATPIPPTPPPAFQVTGVNANVNPTNFIGECPARFDFGGTVTTNAAGTLTYRWTFGSSMAPSANLVFTAPSAGTFAIPNYSSNMGTKGGLGAQMVVVAPNQISSNQVAFANNCNDPKPPPPQAFITEPPNGFVTANNVALRVGFRGIGNTELSRVELYMNGAKVATQSSRSAVRDIQGTYDTRPAPGDYEFYAIAYDIAGQTTRSASVRGRVNPPQPTNTPVPPPTNTPAPPPTQTPVPQKANINGSWRAPNQFIMDLSEAIGCLSASCPVSGNFSDIRGTPLSGTITQGAITGFNLSFQVAFDLPGAPSLSFNGTVAPNGSTISGSWRRGDQSGQVTFVR